MQRSVQPTAQVFNHPFNHRLVIERHAAGPFSITRHATAHMHTCIHAHMHICIQADMHTFTHAYMHTHKYEL